MNLQGAMLHESVKSMVVVVVGHLALQGRQDEKKLLQAMDLPV